MTYLVYAQKARLPQRRPRFLFYRPPRGASYALSLLQPAAVHGQGPSRATEASRHQGNTKVPRHRAKTLRHRSFESLRHQAHTPPHRPFLRPQPAEAPPFSYHQPTPHPSYYRQPPTLRPQPAVHRAEAPRLPAPSKNAPSLPRHKKTGSRPYWGSFPIILLQARTYFCTVPDAASRRLLRCLR